MATEIELAYEYCRRISKRRAKNFYYAFRTLPGPKRRAIYAAYAFCRYCDDVADEEMAPQRKDPAAFRAEAVARTVPERTPGRSRIRRPPPRLAGIPGALRILRDCHRRR